MWADPRSRAAFSPVPRRIALEGAGVGTTEAYERRMAEATSAFFKAIRTAAKALPEGEELRPDSLPWRAAEDAYFKAWEAAAREAAVAMAGEEVGDLGGEILLDNPYVERWLQSHGAELVTEVSVSTQEAIRAAIRDGVLGHETVQGTARGLRDLVGLRTDQMRAVDRFAQLQIADGVDGELLDARIARYARQKVNERALLISRTETMRALNQGKQAGWEQAQADGLILPQAEKVWVVRPSSKRTCDRCAGFYQKTAPVVDGVFTSSSGEQSAGPPLHPACRCTWGLRTVVKSARRIWALGFWVSDTLR